jgi:polysaccharide deacetylase 2 family uncharacterized protein YibQ
LSAGDPLLQEHDPDVPTRSIPRIGPDGRMPMHVYAARFRDPGTRPRVAIMVGGLGMNETDSSAAIRRLPAEVSLAISPYAVSPGPLALAARKGGHECLLAIPMEPHSFPIDDPDDRHALMTSLSPAENLTRLHWVMARMGGYVGLTSLMGQMRGDHITTSPALLEDLLQEIGHRGLLFVGLPRTEAMPPLAANRSADMVLDEDPLDAATLDQRLAALLAAATAHRSALGVVMTPRPVTLDRIAAWARGLAETGAVLAPVSAVVQPAASPQRSP